jgi:hypothetical protein
MAQVTGRVFITVKGRRLASKEGAKLRYGGVSREKVIVDTGVVGFMEKVEGSGVECTIAHTADVKLADFQAMTAETISFDTDTGASYVLSGAWVENALELEKGEVKLIFGALDCKEV